MDKEARRRTTFGAAVVLILPCCWEARFESRLAPLLFQFPLVGYRNVGMKPPLSLLSIYHNYYLLQFFTKGWSQSECSFACFTYYQRLCLSIVMAVFPLHSTSVRFFLPSSLHL